MNTHYAVIVFSGDPANEHPDPERRGQPPSLDLIAAGPEDFCWQALAHWTTHHPLRTWEHAEVLTRLNQPTAPPAATGSRETS